MCEALFWAQRTERMPHFPRTAAFLHFVHCHYPASRSWLALASPSRSYQGRQHPNNTPSAPVPPPCLRPSPPQELADRLALIVRPTVLDMGGRNFTGPLPPGAPLPASGLSLQQQHHQGPGLVQGQGQDQGAPMLQVLHVASRHVTLRNGALLLGPHQELRITGHGCVLEGVSVLQLKTHAGTGAHGPVGRPVTPQLGGAGRWQQQQQQQWGGAASGQQHVVVGHAYDAGRGMVTVSGAVAIRLLRCQVSAVSWKPAPAGIRYTGRSGSHLPTGVHKVVNVSRAR